MKISVLLFTLIFSFAGSAEARDCSSIDLRDENLGRVRHQGYTGWCFAYTMADLAGHKLNEKVSATDLAINFYQKLPEMPRTDLISDASGGSDVGALSLAKESFCREGDMPSERYGVPKECSSKNMEISGILKLIEKLHNEKAQTLSKCDSIIIRSLFKRLSEQDILSSLAKYRTSLEAIGKLKDLNCSENRLGKGARLNYASGFNQNSLVDIDKQLEKGNLIALNYNVGFLLNDSVAGIMYNHYSSIVGRRSNGYSCQYLIRNSWGEDCSQYPAPYNSQCERGNIWVDESVLRNSLISIRYFK